MLLRGAALRFAATGAARPCRLHAGAALVQSGACHVHQHASASFVAPEARALFDGQGPSALRKAVEMWSRAFPDRVAFEVCLHSSCPL
jgi:hypothetical protein